MKIKKIEVKNFKAISDQNADFDGCSAIVTAGNNKGKSTLLRGLIDRFRGEKPEVILKEGEEKGFSILELTDGSKIEWKFTEKTESFSYTTADGIKMTKGVLSAIGEKYFGVKFDVDKFLNSSPKAQSKTLGALVGIDFTEIDSRFKTEYDKRTDANKEVLRLRAIKLTEPVKVEKPNVEELKSELSDLKSKNKKLLDKWGEDNKKHQDSILKYNAEQNDLNISRMQFKSALDGVQNLKGGILEKFIDFKSMQSEFEAMPIGKEKQLSSIETPTLNSTIEIESKIESSNEQLRKFDAYDRDLKAYESWIMEGKDAKDKADKLDSKVKSIEAEKLQMISKANIPEEFNFTEDGITYNGFPLSNAQLSSSSKYIAALKLGLMSLGAIKTMHFDASFLDNVSLNEIQTWASENELQLLIERPDLDGGEIKYEII
jgi:hypothetical protein